MSKMTIANSAVPLCRFIGLLPIGLRIPHLESAPSVAPWAQGQFEIDEDSLDSLTGLHLFPWVPNCRFPAVFPSKKRGAGPREQTLRQRTPSASSRRRFEPVSMELRLRD